MGFIRTLVFVGMPFIIGSTFYAFSLKTRLPQHSRTLGNRIGMFYNYFKIVLKLLKPDTQNTALIADTIRKTNL